MTRGPLGLAELGAALLLLEGKSVVIDSSPRVGSGRIPQIGVSDLGGSGILQASELREIGRDLTERIGLTWRERALYAAAQVGNDKAIDEIEAAERAAGDMLRLYRKLVWIRDAPKIRRHEIVSLGTPYPRTSEDSDLLECRWCGAESPSWDPSGLDLDGRECVPRPDGDPPE